MERTFKADGEEWKLGIDHQAAHPGMRALVFHCISNSGRPYRVLEVPAHPEPDLSGDALVRYFAESHTLDYSTDPSAEAARRRPVR